MGVVLDPTHVVSWFVVLAMASLASQVLEYGGFTCTTEASGVITTATRESLAVYQQSLLRKAELNK